MAEKAALNIARYIRDAPSMEGKEVNVKLYKVLIAVKEVTVETSVTLTYHEEDGGFINLFRGFNILLSAEVFPNFAIPCGWRGIQTVKVTRCPTCYILQGEIHSIPTPDLTQTLTVKLQAGG